MIPQPNGGTVPCLLQDNYCNTGTYNLNGRAIRGKQAWTSRIFVREE
jgi:hypothetical protein